MKHDFAEIDVPAMAPVQDGLSSSESPATSLSSANWVVQSLKKLDDLGRLPQGWDSYGGLPLSPTARRAVCTAMESLKNRELPAPRVVLGPNGNVSLEWSVNEKELEIDFGADGAIEFVKVDDRGSIEEGQIDREVSKTLMSLIDWLIRG